MRVGAPDAVTVIVPVRVVVVLFAVAAATNEPLPKRFKGLKSLTVNQDVLLLVAFHVLSLVTPIVDVAPAPIGAQEDVDTANPTPCVTVMVRSGTPDALTVTVPVLGMVPVFWVTFN